MPAPARGARHPSRLPFDVDARPAAGAGLASPTLAEHNRLMRPTIPLADWRIATDLAATRQLGAVVPPPPCGRDCETCRNWAAAHAAALPEPLATELRRIGVDLARP